MQNSKMEIHFFFSSIISLAFSSRINAAVTTTINCYQDRAAHNTFQLFIEIYSRQFTRSRGSLRSRSS